MATKFKLKVESKTVENLMKEIKDGFVDYRIPSFQRDYVWDGDDVKRLIDSIVRNYPIGSIILWKPSSVIGEKIKDLSEPIIHLKQSYKAHSDITYYIIDGQQRITSLLLLYHGWKIFRINGRTIGLSVPISYVPGKIGDLKNH